jgi:hypothetical protein
MRSADWSTASVAGGRGRRIRRGSLLSLRRLPPPVQLPDAGAEPLILCGMSATDPDDTHTISAAKHRAWRGANTAGSGLATVCWWSRDIDRRQHKLRKVQHNPNLCDLPGGQFITLGHYWGHIGLLSNSNGLSHLCAMGGREPSGPSQRSRLWLAYQLGRNEHLRRMPPDRPSGAGARPRRPTRQRCSAAAACQSPPNSATVRCARSRQMRDLPGNRVPQVGDGDGFIHPLDLVATGRGGRGAGRGREQRLRERQSI